MHMGCDKDIQALQDQMTPDKNYILYGLSRGGSTAISYIQQNNPKNIDAVIIDAAPANVVDAIDEFQHAIGCRFTTDKKAQEQIFNFLFPAYIIGSIPAIENIANMSNKELPIFIVHAKTDTRVHIRSAWQFYAAFLHAGFTNVYLVELDHGKHGYYMNGQDADRYGHALHSFYKKYNFSYNPEFATIDNLEKFQPALQDITQKIAHDQENMHATYEAQKN